MSDNICLIKCKLKNILILKQSGLSLRFTVASLSGKVAGMVIFISQILLYLLCLTHSQSQSKWLILLD